MPRTRAQVLKESRALSCPYYKKKTSSATNGRRFREMPCVEEENPPCRTRAERKHQCQPLHPQFLVETTWLPPGVRVTKKGGKVRVEGANPLDLVRLGGVPACRKVSRTAKHVELILGEYHPQPMFPITWSSLEGHWIEHEDMEPNVKPAPHVRTTYHVTRNYHGRISIDTVPRAWFSTTLMGYHPGNGCVFSLHTLTVDGTLYLREEDEKLAYAFDIQWGKALSFPPDTKIKYLSVGGQAMVWTCDRQTCDPGSVLDGGVVRVHSGAHVSLGRMDTPLDEILVSGERSWVAGHTPCKRIRATYGGTVDLYENDIPETTVDCFQRSEVVVEKAQHVRVRCAGSSHVWAQCNSCEGHEKVEQGSRVVFERR